MRKTIITFALAGLCQTLAAQDSARLYENYFQELREVTQQSRTFWNKDLYGPLLLVHPDTRKIIANFPDSTGVLHADGSLFVGVLPAQVNVANTAVDWGGRRWAMLLLPLSDDKKARLNLLTHELFHVVQPSLGFSLFNPDNNHLDLIKGRTYLRLEIEALLHALRTTEQESTSHIRSALVFRKLRRSLFSGADSTENRLELNEGIAEYTGTALSGRTHAEMIRHFATASERFFNRPTFVRAFAYQTIPMYGYLLQRSARKEWHKDISVNTNLTSYFTQQFGIVLPTDLQKV